MGSSSARRSTIFLQETPVPMDPRYPIGKFQPPLEVTSALRQQAIEIISELPANLREAASELSPTQLDTPYRQGGWTVRQLIHHVADSHLNAYMRHRLALTEDQPTIKPYDENLWAQLPDAKTAPDRKSTRLNSSHLVISYAVFCLKK